MNQLQLFLILVVLGLSYALPVTKVEEKKEEHKDETADDVEGILEYERYLKEVVGVLETDPQFRAKLDNASEVDVRSGKIAHELEYVGHQVRTKLDEIKRRELERLRLMATKEFELMNEIDRDHLKILDHGHIDHDNQHTFEIEDLKKLILKTSKDLEEADRARREEFKQYELQKEFEKQEKLKTLDEDNRKQYEDELRKQKEKHNQHERVHHPGNKAQLEEVWEKEDHMDPADFQPKPFFMLHDLDGNGFWDETEVKALFGKELDKVYQSGLPEDDMRERVEEMERMREHVFKEADTNQDKLISFDEFLEQTKREEFNRDPGWETVDNTPQFTHEEYLEFERRRQDEIQRLIAQGVLPPHPNMPQGYYPNQNGYQMHPNEIPTMQKGYPQPPQQQQYYQQQQGHGQVPQQHVYNPPPPNYQQHPQQQYQNYPQQPNQVYQQPQHAPHPNIQVRPPAPQVNNVPIQSGQPVQQHPSPPQQQQQQQQQPQQQLNQPPPANQQAGQQQYQQPPPANQQAGQQQYQQPPPINQQNGQQQQQQQQPPPINQQNGQQQQPNQNIVNQAPVQAGQNPQTNQ